MTTALGRFVQYRRKEVLGLTQEELGEKIGKEQNYVSQLERGLIQRPSDEVIDALTVALEVSRRRLFEEAGWIESDDGNASDIDLDDPFVHFWLANSHKYTDEQKRVLMELGLQIIRAHE